MANVLVISETPQRVIIRDEAATRTVKVVALGPQGPSGNVNPLMFEMLDQANAASRSASISATAAGEHYAATSIRADEAEASAASALASQQSSTTSAESASQSAASASANANTAISSASSASLSASSANTSATNAQASATTATTKASEAAASAVAAQGAAAGVQANSEAAVSSAVAAAASQSAAAASESSASGSATSASASASAASVSATNAAGSATSAGSSATAAAASAATASTKAGEASASAASALDSKDVASVAAQFAINAQSAAQTSANAALASKNAAAASATDAANSATASAGSATAASGSATSASGSASTATTKASEAATSATNAAASATTASTKASEASASATNAAASASAAATSATNTANALVGERSAVATLTNKTITGPVIDSGTANGVAYLNSSKVLTSGSGLTFNGTTLSASGAILSGATFFSTGGAGESSNGMGMWFDAATNQGNIRAYHGGVDWRNIVYNAKNHIWQVTDVEQMRLTSTGLGIGTSSPEHKVHIADGLPSLTIQGLSVGEFGLRIQAGEPFVSGLTYDSTTGESRLRGDQSYVYQTIFAGGQERLRIDSAGNLGLGVVPSVWSASYKTIQIGSIGSVSSTNSAAYIGQNWYQDAAGQNRYITAGIAASFGSDATGAHVWYKAPSGAAGSPISFTQAMTLGANGNLGIGTSSPARPLDVKGSARLSDGAALEWGGVSAGINGSSTNNIITISTASTERLRVDSAGNLGVGTSSPSAKIVTAQSGGGNTAYASVDSWSDDVQTSRSGIGFNARIDHTAYSQAAVQLDAAKSGWLIQGRNAPGAEAVYDWFSVSRVSPTGVSTKMLNLDANGNLGLGVVPSVGYGREFSISSDIGSGVGGFGVRNLAANNNITYLSNNTKNTGAFTDSYWTSAGAFKYQLDNGGHKWFTAPSGTAGQPISFTQAMTLDASGNLGIGTSAPLAPLHVHRSGGSSIRIDTDAAASSTQLNFATAGVNKWSLYRPGSGADLRLFDNVNTVDVMTWQAGGNVGIGTSSPAEKLSLYDASSLGIRMDSPDSIVRFMQGATTKGYLRMIGGTTNRLQLVNNSNELTLDSSGNLGLGVVPSANSIPGSVVQVGPAGFIGKSFGPTNNQAILANNVTFGAGGAVNYGAHSDSATMLRQINGRFQWFTAPSGTAGQPISFTQAMTLDASGNLGLGATPSAWGSNYKALQINSGGAGVASTSRNLIVAGNAYNDNTSWRYVAGAPASMYNCNGIVGQHEWSVAPSGIAGSPISFIQAMVLDAGGTLGVGKAPSRSGRVEIKGTTNTSGVQGNHSEYALHISNLSDTAYLGFTHSTISQVGGDPLSFATLNSERARIDINGNLLVGATGVSDQSKVRIAYDSGLNQGLVFTDSAASTGKDAVRFKVNGSTVGSISTSTTATTYNTSSDYRLKNITGPVTTSGAYIDSLNPVEGSWEADGSTFVGLIAHEVQEASRTQVATGVKDGEEMQAMDYSASELIANMIAELKSLRARVAALENN